MSGARDPTMRLMNVCLEFVKLLYDLNIFSSLQRHVVERNAVTIVTHGGLVDSLNY